MDSPSFLRFAARNADLERLRRRPEIASLEVDSESGSDFASAYSNSSGEYAHTLPNFGIAGTAGKSIVVGVLEQFLKNGCEIGEEHEAFSALSVGPGGKKVDYLASVQSCISPSSCNCVASVPTGSNVYCTSAGHCRVNDGDHTTQVASRIAGHAGTTNHHASRVSLVVANNSDIHDVAKLTSDYESFVSKGVTIINQSFSPPQRWSPIHSLMDWESYNRRVLLVQATADGPIAGTSSQEQQVTSCIALNSLCVASTNAQGTYNSYTNDTFAQGTTENPFDPTQSVQSRPHMDVERPDVVSEGAEAVVANSQQSMLADWTTKSGTSFAAPVVTGLAAILAKKCQDNGWPFSPELMRSIIRTGSPKKHTMVPTSFPSYPYGGLAGRYSGSRPDGGAPNVSRDYFVGVGIPDGDSLNLFCNPQSPPDCSVGCAGSSSGSNLGTLPWQAIPSWMMSASHDSNGNVSPGNRGKGPLKPTVSQYAKLASLGNLSSGSRVRATFSFSVCPDASVQAMKPVPTGDYDLVLCPLGQSCLAVSDSFDDVNEGFDVILPGSGQTYSDVQMFVVRPTGTGSCNTAQIPGGPAPHPFDPWSISWIVWQ